MTTPIAITDELLDLIVGYQDIGDSEVYYVVSDPAFDEFVQELQDEIGLDDDSSLTDWENQDAILRSATFDKGLKEVLRNKAEVEMETVMSYWRYGPATLYREIRLNVGPNDFKKALNRDLGESWTVDPMKAISYMNESGKFGYTFTAEVGYSAIDWEQTLIRRCNLAIGEQEDEVTLLRGMPIRVVSIECDDEPLPLGELEPECFLV